MTTVSETRNKVKAALAEIPPEVGFIRAAVIVNEDRRPKVIAIGTDTQRRAIAEWIAKNKQPQLD